MINNRVLSWCDTQVLLPAVCVNQPEAAPPLFSQITGLVVLPNGAPGPSNWTLAEDINGIIDNSSTDNSKAKFIEGKGGIAEREVVIADLGKRTRHKAGARYVLEFEFSIRNDGQYSFAQKMQGNYKAFQFWFLTYGGRTLGGSVGIAPDYADAVMPMGRESDDVEKCILSIEWYADADVLRTSTGGDITSPSGGITPTPLVDVVYYHQPFTGQSSNVLTWTENGGVLPTTNTQAQIWVFQRGQKLEEGAAVQYTISHNTAPGESQIIINSATHYTGADYEVIAIITS